MRHAEGGVAHGVAALVPHVVREAHAPGLSIKLHYRDHALDVGIGHLPSGTAAVGAEELRLAGAGLA